MIPFNNTYIKLPESFYERVNPSIALNPVLIAYNYKLAQFLNIDFEDSNKNHLAQVFSGKTLLMGSEPIALAYSGHQFGQFSGPLGDGRALLLGEVVATDGKRYDIQLKGSGPTRFSRGGDGRSSLGPVLREFIVSEAMWSLGVPTTRALAAVETGEYVDREGVLPGAIFARVASSHIRVGTFEYFSSSGKFEDLKILTDYAIQRHDSDLVNTEDKYNLFFERVAKRKLGLVAQWMGIGFVHGVMNTDNTSITGETIDYGPCAFMDEYSHNKVFSSIDRRGRYAFDQQGEIALWNLSILANSLLPLLKLKGESEEASIERLNALFNNLNEYFRDRYVEVMCKKMGIFNSGVKDLHLVEKYLCHLEKEKLDFTNSFRGLSEKPCEDKELMEHWRRRLNEQPQSSEEVKELMNKSNPYLIPRNHQVEKAIQAGLKGDYSHFYKLCEVYKNPYKTIESNLSFTLSPTEEERVHKTFCGT